ncbi:MAG TPA: phenylalanine--tRNA ligase subunit alpha [Candidatus Magasanikbacteria bacterium]|nr:phenylalanine--tRNA ligase subunit alpha [Candidatus Magasanikbacteria bacterium]
MKQALNALKKEAERTLKKITVQSELFELETALLGRKGKLTEILKGLKDTPKQSRKAMGVFANRIKEDVLRVFENKKQELDEKQWASLAQDEWNDLSEPALPVKARGHLHPRTIVGEELEAVFKSLGFMVLEGPELESDFYNFEALNFPSNHPARESMDTFFIKNQPGWLLRTHTSPLQVRAVQKYGAPIRAIVPGRVFRNEATDASHEHTFYQLEGIMIDKGISIANLIAVMKELLQGVFKRTVEVRLRPGHFPFVEPGFELDMKCLLCGGAGCSACKHKGWLEVLPCGMMHPRVLEFGGVDPREYSGFAFGLGWDRLVMMRYNIEDIRHLNSGDMKFLTQF